MTWTFTLQNQSVSTCVCCVIRKHISGFHAVLLFIYFWGGGGGVGNIKIWGGGGGEGRLLLVENFQDTPLYKTLDFKSVLKSHAQDNSMRVVGLAVAT